MKAVLKILGVVLIGIGVIILIAGKSAASDALGLIILLLMGGIPAALGVLCLLKSKKKPDPAGVNVPDQPTVPPMPAAEPTPDVEQIQEPEPGPAVEEPAAPEPEKDPYDLQLTSITFDQLYDRWSEEHFRKISQSGITSYRSVYSCCGDIGRMKICDIKLDHLQRIMDGSGKNSPTLKTMKNLFGLMWDYAVIHEIITPDRREMIRYLDISKPGNPNKMNRQPFTRKELDRLWEMKDANVYISVVLIMIYTGVRIGELLDLKKEDVHLEERWMYIKEAKTAAGIREVPIAEKIVFLMEQWISRSCDHLICSGSDAVLSYYVFRENYWNPVMDLLSMDHRPHDTRHTCVSLLTEAGVDERIIRKIVGHKGQGVTETVYTHMELPVKLEAINKI